MASYSEILFGRVVVRNGLVTPAQVVECLRDLRGQSLGEAMVRRGFLSPDQALSAQRAQALMQFVRAEKIFARILLERRLVDGRTLKRAFNVQKQRDYKVRLAALLIEGRLLTAEQVEEVVDEQLVRLADETARIEEQGLDGAMVDSNENEDLGPLDTPEDLDSSAMQRAVGPKGLLDAPRFKSTLPLRPAARLDEPEPQRKRTMVMESRRLPAERAPAAAPARPAPTAAPAARVDSDDLIGTVVASRYRVLDKVGEGGMGTVYRAEHCLMEKIVALKVLNTELVSSKQSLDQFRLEIRAASRFQHKHVIQIYDAGEGEGGIFYMAMEFADGETLEDVLARQGALSLDQALEFLRQILGAVGEAHKKSIVHRDLKTGNVMVVLDPKTNERIVKVMDFGIAKIAFEESGLGSDMGGLYRTQEGVVTGTPQYMSPEQASGEKVDHRSDLYSIGVILFEMVTGQLPFRSDTPMGFLGKHIVEPPPRPSAVRPDLAIPQVVEEVALRLLEKRPDDRYQTAGEVLRDLELRCSGDALHASTSTSGSSALLHRPRAYTPTIASTPAAQLPPATAAAPAVRPPPVVTLPAPAAAKAGVSPWVVALLAFGLLVLLSVSTTVALLAASKKPPRQDPQALAKAKELLAAERWAEAVRALEPLADKNDPEGEASKLLAQAREKVELLRSIRQQITHADELVAQFLGGTAGREAAEKALQLYRDAQRYLDEPELAQKVESLTARLNGVSPSPSPSSSSSPKASPSPSPSPSEVPSPSPSETPSPSPSEVPSPSPSERPSPSPSAAGGEADLMTAATFLQENKLGPAAEALERAAKVLPADHPKLVQLSAHLAAERLADEAGADRRAGRLADARAKLETAIARHPHPPRVEALKRELAAVERDQAAAQRDQVAATALDRSRQAALQLDLAAARAALAAAKGSTTDALVRRASALDALEPASKDWRRAREALTALGAAERGDPAQAAQARVLLESLRERFGAAFPDAELGRELLEALNLDAGRAKELEARLGAMREQSKSKELLRFEGALARYRQQQLARETRQVVLDRLSAAQELQYMRAYRGKEASEEDRRFVEQEETRWRKRRQVWDELVLDDKTGESMVLIAGGRWTPPGRKEVALPERFYAAPHELTAFEWDQYLRSTGKARPTDWPEGVRQPVRTISLAEARAYCRWRNKTLKHVALVVPSEDMWEKAARGEKGTAFPWGDTFEDWREGYAAVAGTRPRPVGSFDRDKNDLGLFDTVGNLRELTETSREGKVVVCGGSAVSARNDAGAAARKLVPRGEDSSPTIGVRLFALEK
ncbi:MAG: protein kinase [Planctomycetota bacterium]